MRAGTSFSVTDESVESAEGLDRIHHSSLVVRKGLNRRDGSCGAWAGLVANLV